MTYFVSDLHGEYELFCTLLDKINFTDSDTMYVCGDILEKGNGSLKLLSHIYSKKNIHCVIGNHDKFFLRFYRKIMEKSPTDFDKVLESLRNYFFEDEGELTWAMVDYLDTLPYYIETDSFICVHAGIPIDENGYLMPLNTVDKDSLISDRRFKDDDVIHKSEKCVFFGHTVAENAEITLHKRPDCDGKNIKDYYKIRLDTGSWQNGTLGCFCLEKCECIYVYKNSVASRAKMKI